MSRVFKDEKELRLWCLEKETHCRIHWIRTLYQQKQVTLYWCILLRHKPKMILRKCDKPFIENCVERAGPEVTQLRECDVWQVKTIIKGKIVSNGSPKRRKEAIHFAQDLANSHFNQVIVEHSQTCLRIYDNRKRGKKK